MSVTTLAKKALHEVFDTVSQVSSDMFSLDGDFHGETYGSSLLGGFIALCVFTCNNMGFKNTALATAIVGSIGPAFLFTLYSATDMGCKIYDHFKKPDTASPAPN